MKPQSFCFFAVMISISHKTKHFAVFFIKILIVLAAFYFIYYRLTNDKSLDWPKFWNLITINFSITGILFLVFLSILNRYLEIVKWQNLVSSITPITISESTKQVLSALTAGIFTPNGVGEYAGKALYFDSSQTKEILFLNLVCNGAQMVLTVLFGVLGLFYIGFAYWAFAVIGLATVLCLFVFFTKKVTIKGFSLERLFFKINTLPRKIHFKNNSLALGRYLVFSHQYYFLFVTFGVDLPYLTLMASIAIVYFLASSLPSFQFLDFAVKGSVAVFFFGKLGVSEWISVLIATLMWLLNVVIPVVIGSFYVLKYKPKWD